MSGYDPGKADIYNQLIQQGLTQREAAAEAGIDPNDNGNYVIGNNGEMGPVIVGIGPNDTIITAADRDIRERESPLFQEVDYAVKADSQPSPITNTTSPVPADDLPPALAAQQPFPATGAVPVDVAPVPAPTVRPIADPEFSTPPDPAVERQQIAAAVAQGDEVGQGADTNLVVDRTIDPTAGEGPQTVVATPTSTPAAVDPDFALELQNLETAQANEDRRFLETALPVPPDFEDQFDANPPIEEPGEIGDEDPEVAALLEQQRAINQADVANAYSTPEPVPEEFTGYGGASFDEEKALNEALKQQAAQNTAAGQTNAAVKNTQQQNTLSARVNTPASADWRVRLSLAPTSTYLYNAQNAGILAPLKRTGGVVFPYTPQIDMAYQAKYDGVDLTHSNYRGYFYRNSSVDQVSIRAAFTAQDTREAEYLLAVITFFKSVTKMFYGAQDPNRGMPPPLVFLTGMGQYQFNNNPCVVSNFQYNLPSDVDYIRANGFNNYGINMDNRRQQGSGPPATGILGAIAQVNRLINSNLVQGMLGNNQNSANRSTNPVSANNSKTNYTNSTYVPTKMEISLTLLPIQTRSQMSAQFDLQKFSAGQLLQQPGGFW